ncbi:hypothetical protein TIFTF001_015479 [Ficus carica]|uniref:Uncharacterized protein n=1 Tax=Ficus carica TaxID=3494 RepID=A0AA88D7W5_FICCA|nr:hypothetical protein TIFTF001_015479 [Ficus carica]
MTGSCRVRVTVSCRVRVAGRVAGRRKKNRHDSNTTRTRHVTRIATPRLPVLLGAAYMGIRRHLHQRYNQLHVGQMAGKEYDNGEIWYRTADGKCNHPSDDLIGSQGTFFGRNMPPSTSGYGVCHDIYNGGGGRRILCIRLKWGSRNNCENTGCRVK